jgi:hypothetical protein
LQLRGVKLTDLIVAQDDEAFMSTVTGGSGERWDCVKTSDRQVTHFLEAAMYRIDITESCTVECGVLFGGTYKNIKDGRGMESTEVAPHGGAEKIHGFEREGHITGR